MQTDVLARRDPNLVKSILHAAQVLAAFRFPGEMLPLHEITSRCGLPKTMVYRMLYTMERAAMIEKVSANVYQSCIRPLRERRYRIGYAAQGADYEFSREVTLSLERAVAAENVELIRVDNKYNPKVAQKNAEFFVREKVDLVIEFQTDEMVAPIVATKYHDAGIPFIAIEIPHPGATYYGANNYQAGLIGGRYLGRWVKQNWQAVVDLIVLFELPRAGKLPNMRMSGIQSGIREFLPASDRVETLVLDGDGQFNKSFELMRKHLRGTRYTRCLLSGINDSSVLGALRAFEEAGRSASCVAMGLNASPEARQELRTPGSRLVGSVAFFPEKYGDGVLRLALDILNKRPVPPAVFVEHKLVTPRTVDHFYPNDLLLTASRAP
jgi:ribose transport system substrate-binding protein